MRMRWGTRLTTALAVTLVPVAVGPLSLPLLQTSASVRPTAPPAAQAAADVGLVPPPQPIAPRVTIEGRLTSADGKVTIEGPRGARVWSASALLDHDLPAAALKAYKAAAASTARTDPSCRLPWTLLAGIGRVESDHGRYGGSVLGSDGVPRPAIIGIALDGQGPVAAIPDTDNGRFDGDKVWDRAVGPMQFIPSTWQHAGRDGDGNGVKNPNDIDDAALAAAGYLCSGSGSVASEAGMSAAIFRYNPSDYYVSLVMAFERGYRTGVFVIPSPPAPVQAAAAGPAKHHAHHAKKHATASSKHKAAKHATTSAQPKPSTTPSSKPAPKPTQSKPSPAPSKSPSPSPSPSPSQDTLELVSLSGQLDACGTTWCVGGTELDLGPAGQLAATAATDFDGDGAKESNADELTGLVGTSMDLRVKKGTAPAVVYLVNGAGYRNADGSFTQ